MNLIEFLVTLLLGGPWLLIGALLGILGAWAAWTYLPLSTDRAAMSALVLIAGLGIGAILNGWQSGGPR